MRDLYQDTRTVSGFRVAAARAPVREIDKHFNSFTNNVVTLVSLDAGNEPNATGIVFVARVIQALSAWQPVDGFNFGIFCALHRDTQDKPVILAWTGKCHA